MVYLCDKLLFPFKIPSRLLLFLINPIQTSHDSIHDRTKHATMSDDTQIHDPVDEQQTEHPFEKPGRVLSEDDANDGRDLALQLNAKFKRTKSKYVIKARDMPAIIKNPKVFPVNKTGFTSKRAQAVLKHHRVLAKHFLAHPSDEDKPEPLPQGQPNLQAARGETEKKRAHARDQFMCNVLETFYSEMAHVIPFSLTGTTVAVEEMRECFLIMKTLISPRFYKMWLSCALALGGFEKDYNLFALNPFIHTLFDEGVIAFQPLHDDQYEEDDKFYAPIQIQWLPVCTALTKAVAILDKGPNDVVARLFNEVETAFEQGFLPRLPAKGAGSLWICFKDGEQVKSGHTFDIEFPTALERDYYADLMGAHYEIMLLLTLQGKTKGFPPVVGDHDDDDSGDVAPPSPGSPAASVSSPARGPVAPPPASTLIRTPGSGSIATRTRLASRFYDSTASSRAKHTPRKR